MRNEINVSFCICDYDDITHQQISNELGLIASNVSHAKDLESKAVSKKKEDKWVYGTPYGNMENFGEQMEKILDALEPKVSVLEKFARKYTCKFRVVIFLRNREESTPWFFLEKRYNAFIKKIDAVLDIEVYTPEFPLLSNN
ncbi:DUF4279 domain-containing protein [Sphingobacterium thalpophilum]|uniref:DUF4279 domain-containing protein n=1 Tax=Sphingobacterium thalpophilum TaxID=259 RepID=A0A4U9VDT8_9SPHI|nr:DUF4279 domain-containing protein [Sphingobacterium thalpophilum]VTR43302.1 Uncharacterised protein [Sphingobacterium thalpophilum]